MSEDLKLSLDPAMIRDRFRAMGFKYSDIERESNNEISIHQLKHFMNKGKKADESIIRCLAEILECDENDLIDKGALVSENIPSDINLLLSRLYERKKEDIQMNYRIIITQLRSAWPLEKMLQISHRLFSIFADENIDFDHSLVLKAVVLIIDALSENNCINNLQFTALDNQFSQKLLNLLRNYGTEQYNPQQVILIFIYVCIIFDAVFLEELVGSAFELMPQRANNKADQYSHLAGTSEKMRNVLIDMVIYQGYCLDRPDVEQLGIVDLMIDGIILMLAVCEKCRKHVEGEFVASEYVNRATFDAILNKLKGILSKTGINVPNYTPMELCCTRFTILYNGLKNLYTSFNPPKRPRTYQDGYNAAIKDAMTLLCVGKQSNN